MSTASLTCAGCGNVNPADVTQCLACGQALQGNTTISRSLTGLLSADHLLKQRYRIIAQIGKGGFGAVYQAADSAFGDRLVAIKEMSQNRLTPQEMAEATEAFKREALLLAELRHPNLPRIYDYFSDAGRWYLVMDFIEGETLEERLYSLSGRGLAGEEVLDIGIQLCSVLDYLHTRHPPIIFRDLKPANVMRTPTGHLYLIDFGIARHFKPGQIKDTMPLGSPGYAAPEQYGKGQTTPRADIYSLGVTLHQLLTGSDPAQTPFRLAPLQLDGHPILSQLETLIKHMSELDEANRPQSIAVVTPVLQRIAKQQVSEPQGGVPSHVPSPPQTDSPTGTPLAEAQDGEQQLIMLGPRQRDPLPRRGLSRRSVFIGAGAGLLALVGGITWRWLARPQPTPAPSPVTTQPTVIQQATNPPAPNIGSSGVGGGAEWSTLTVVERVVYVGPAHNKVYAIDAGTGQQKWAFPARNATSDWGSWVHPSPTVVDGVVYVGSGDRKVYAIDTRTGQQKWAFPTGDEVRSSPTVVDGVLYVGSLDHKVYAIDTRTGQQQWAFPTGAYVHLSPTIVKGVVYVGGDDGTVYAIDTRTGQQKWAFPIGSSDSVLGSVLVASPIVANGVVYVGSADNKVHAIDARTGQQKWSFFMGWNGFISPAMVVNGVLYIGSIDGRVYAIDAQTGQEKWAFPVNEGVYAALTVVNGVVYVISIPGIVYAIDSETGQQKWTVPTGNATGSWVQPPPIVVNGVVYVSSDDKNVYAIDAKTGQQQWAVPTDSQGRFSPVANNGMLYITGTDDGQVYAIDATTGQQKWTFST